MNISSFHPPERTLMGPGPSDINPRVLAAISRPTIGHLDPAFVGMMDEVKELLRFAFGTQNEMTMPISAPGSAGMEFCFVNLVEPEDTVIICRNGAFGSRMQENTERCGGRAVMVDAPWGEAIKPDSLIEALKANPETKIVAFVQAETSTGVNSDARALAKIAQEYNCLTIVDTVTSLGGSELKVDEWGLDAVYSGSQKCLSCPPGLSPVSLSQKALDKVRNRKTKVQSWFLDSNLLTGYWGEAAKRSYHHTAPINSLYGLHESLLILKEAGLEESWNRHMLNHQALRSGLLAMGLPYLTTNETSLPQLNAVQIPSGIDESVVREILLRDFNLEIGAGLGALAGKIWRVGLMGHSSNPTNVFNFLGALDSVLSSLNATINSGVALPAAKKVYESE